MPPRELPDVLTRATPAEVGRALVRAWRAIEGREPDTKSIVVLLAQGALETGRWRSMHCWNLGNVKSVAGDGRSWTFFRCNEILNGKEVWFDPPHPACRFRAFETLDEGAVDYLALLRRRYVSAWPAVLVGDPVAFVRAIKRAGYFTAAEEPYVRSVASLFAEFSTIDLSAPQEPTITDEDRARIEALITRTLLDAGRDAVDEARRDTEPAPPPSGNAC